MKAPLFRPSLSSLKLLRGILQSPTTRIVPRGVSPFLRPRQYFHDSPVFFALRTQDLYELGEGTKEAEIIQWFVEEGAHIEEWGKICEVTHDKGTIEITSKYGGVVKKIYAEKDTIVQVGQPLLDIEVEGEEDDTKEEANTSNAKEKESEQEQVAQNEQEAEGGGRQEVKEVTQETRETAPEASTERPEPKAKHASLATPAVRGMVKLHSIAIEDIRGTGKDGRVMKEDVQRYISERDSRPAEPSASASELFVDSEQAEKPQRLSHIQSLMFKTMTASLSIPHFLYSDDINVTLLSSLRKRLNEARDPSAMPKLSFLPFAIKAVSLALYKYPLLNARIDMTTNPQKPQLIMRSNHNIGIAMDTPAGLLVPIIRNVNARSIVSIALEIARLSELGQAGKLSNADLSGGTITVSNIGNIGGGVLAPIIVEGQVAIMGMGKVKAVPIFSEDGQIVERADMMAASWSADHRVVDGATMARAATVVQGYLERPEKMIVEMS